MKCTIPEISWHNRDPVLSVDIQVKKPNEQFTRLASGGTDTHVLIWHLHVESTGIASLECAADLTRHSKPVNIVRFSPSGEYLASGDDESSIIIWKQKSVSDAPDIFANTDSDEYKEQWLVERILRGHLQDVFDISWSPDSKNLVSGSVDNTAIIWDLTNGRNLGILSDHKGFVQGVAWDPCKQYVATISSDRVCRVFNAATRRIVSRVSKARLPGSDPETKPVHLFHDDTIKTFFRRLTFTPDGELLIVPTGIIEQHDVGEKPLNSTVIFKRSSFTKPVAFLPSLKDFTVAARCCPVLFKLKPMAESEIPLFDLQYRIVIAIATQSNIILYDTQHVAPFAFIANIHYTRLTDLTWSQDGRVLVVSSTDGYCSIITFAEGELGEVYNAKKPSSDTDTQNTKEVAETLTTKAEPVVKDEQSNNEPSAKKKAYIETEKVATRKENGKATVGTKKVKEEKSENQSVGVEKISQSKEGKKTIFDESEKLQTLGDVKTPKDDSESPTSGTQLTSENVEVVLNSVEKRGDTTSTETPINQTLQTTLKSEEAESNMEHTPTEEVKVDSNISKTEAISSKEKDRDELKNTKTFIGESDALSSRDEKHISMEIERRGEVTPTKNSSSADESKETCQTNKGDTFKVLELEQMDVDDDVLEVGKGKVQNENKDKMNVDQDFQLLYEDTVTEALKNKNNELSSGKSENDASHTQPSKEQNECNSFPCPKPNSPMTPGRKTPRRVQLITLSSPKNKKK